MAAAEGRLTGHSFEWRTGPSVCVVIASGGYPGTFETGKEIRGVAEAEASGASIFQAGTRILHGRLETAGGRVLGVTASGSDLSQAITRAYTATEHIAFDRMHYRRDIGRKGLRSKT
jgi:phosphoribosylamine--glycine ligase